jgi:diacylglycerol kinase (ATP)
LNNRNFIIFINPISGTRSKADIKKLVADTLVKHGYTFQFLPTEQSGDYSFLKNKIENEKTTDVIICGGDGTISHITAHLQNIDVHVGIVPMGSGNGLAFTAGIPKDPQKALNVIVHGTAKYIDAFWINERFACHNFGVGFDGKVAHEFSVSPKRGPMTYVKLAIKNYFKEKAYKFSVEADGIKLEVSAFFIGVLNGNQFGNSLTIAPKAILNDGLLDVVIFKKSNKLNVFLKMIHQFRRGKVTTVENDKKLVHYFQTKKLQITNTENALIHIDGEPVDPIKTIEISVIENAYKLIQP